MTLSREVEAEVRYDEVGDEFGSQDVGGDSGPRPTPDQPDGGVKDMIEQRQQRSRASEDHGILRAKRM